MTLPLSRRSLLGAGGAFAGFAFAPRVAFAQSDRIESLIARMTIAEKAGQLSCFGDAIRPPRVPFNPNAVSSSAGICRSAASVRMQRSTPTPSSPGNRRSTIMASGRATAARRKPASPLPASSVR